MNCCPLFIGFLKVGGYNAMWELYGTAIGKSVSTTAGNITTAGNATTSNMTTACFKLTPYWGNMFRPIDDPGYPWLGLWTTLPIMGVWYWCTDQVQVYSLHFKPCFLFASTVLGLDSF